MRWRTKGLLATMLLASSAGVAGADDEWPRDTTYDGPIRFCSHFYAIEVPQGEQVTVRDPGLDFLVTYFETDAHWLGAYEGNHPQTTDKEIRRVRLLPGVRLDRMTDDDNKTSYLIHVTQGDIPVYLHVFSDQFAGDEGDRAVLERFVLGGFDKTGCERPTYMRG